MYSSEIGLLLLTLGTGVINSRFLGATQYGHYTFIITIVELVTLFGGFGVAPSGARLLALSDSKDETRALLGALVCLGIGLGATVASVLALAAPLIDILFKTELKHLIYFGAILCLNAPLTLILYRACRGTNEIGLLATITILPKALYLIIVLVVIVFSELSAFISLIVYFLGSLGATFFAVIKFRVRFENLKANFVKLLSEIKSYGFNVYLGGIADNSTYKLNTLLIAAFVDTTWLGFYYIASTMVSPMARFSTSIASSLYQGFARKTKIPSKVLIVNAVFLLVCAIGIAIIARPFISLVLTDQYLPATNLIYILIFTALFQGLYTPVNFFLSAHGKGRESRTISFFVSIVNLASALILIPPLGAVGAALGSVIAKFCELSGNVYFYKKILSEVK